MNKLPILTKEEVNQQMKNMQNEPNFKKPKINVTLFTAVNYDNFYSLAHRKNEPNRSQFHPLHILPAKYRYTRRSMGWSKRWKMPVIADILLVTN